MPDLSDITHWVRSRQIESMERLGEAVQSAPVEVKPALMADFFVRLQTFVKGFLSSKHKKVAIVGLGNPRLQLDHYCLFLSELEVVFQNKSEDSKTELKYIYKTQAHSESLTKNNQPFDDPEKLIQKVRTALSDIKSNTAELFYID